MGVEYTSSLWDELPLPGGKEVQQSPLPFFSPSPEDGVLNVERESNYHSPLWHTKHESVPKNSLRQKIWETLVQMDTIQTFDKGVVVSSDRTPHAETLCIVAYAATPGTNINRLTYEVKKTLSKKIKKYPLSARPAGTVALESGEFEAPFLRLQEADHGRKRLWRRGRQEGITTREIRIYLAENAVQGRILLEQFSDGNLGGRIARGPLQRRPFV